MKSSHATRGLILLCAMWLACFGGPPPSIAETVTICSKGNPKYQPQKGTLVGMDRENITVNLNGGQVSFKRADFDYCPGATPPDECPANQIISGGRCVAPGPGIAVTAPGQLPPGEGPVVPAKPEDKQQTCLGVKKTLEASTDPRILVGLATENKCPELHDALLNKVSRLLKDNGPKRTREPEPQPELPGPVAADSQKPPSFGRPQEAVDMARRAKAKIKKDGSMAATIRAVNSRARGFFDRDLYVFIIDFNGTELANGQQPALTGRNVLPLKDEYGKRLVRGLIALAKGLANGKGGWYDYRWPNPYTKTIEVKSSYVERLDDDSGLVGVGVYKNPNENIVHVISGSLNSDDNYLQMASDMADVVNDDNLRVIPVASFGGPAQNLYDVRSLHGTEIGLTQTGILTNYRRNSELLGNAENKIVYIAPLFNEQVHLVAGNNIASIEDLRGKTVNIGEGSGTIYSMRDIFDKLGIQVEEVSVPQAKAFEMVKSGEIAATALIADKPVRSVSMARLTAASGLHFVPIPSSSLGPDYPATSLTHEDYPDLIPTGQLVGTVAVRTALITYDWPKTDRRYQPVARFVEAFFDKFKNGKFKERHPKWREVDIGATLDGWTRFEPAQRWLDRQREARKSGN